MLAGASPPRAHDDDCLRLPAAPPSRNSKAEKKQSPAHHPSQLCPPYGAPFSPCSLGHRRNAVHTAENGYATRGGLSRKCQSSASWSPHAENLALSDTRERGGWSDDWLARIRSGDAVHRGDV